MFHELITTGWQNPKRSPLVVVKEGQQPEERNHLPKVTVTFSPDPDVPSVGLVPAQSGLRRSACKEAEGGRPAAEENGCRL